jgi:hypothetical protein
VKGPSIVRSTTFAVAADLRIGRRAYVIRQLRGLGRWR